MKTLRRVLLSLGVLLLLAAIAGYLYLRSLIPSNDGRLDLPGLKSAVEVIYDDHSVPHIYASNEPDLFRAFGYVHARDRLFQMEVLRRLAGGRLAEVFGEAALPSDRFFRVMSFKPQAERLLDSLRRHPESPFMQAATAYVDGVNEYIRTGPTPIEFTIAGIPKTPFTLEDMEVIVAYMGYTFVGAFRTEAVATEIATRLGEAYLRDVFANWPDSAYKIPVQPAGSVPANPLTYMGRQMESMLASLPYPPMTGSNGWVISGRKTKSGKPILANDTHIAFAQPSVWYEAHLECPGLSIYGNFLAGAPFPALGHSQRSGWGITMFENDDIDFFREKANPADSNQVWYKDHWEDLERRTETIKVKGAPDERVVVRKSRHGYILNGAFDGVKGEKEPIAVWWVYQQMPSRHLKVFYDLAHAADVREAAAAVEQLTSPGLNIMWADTLGNIAWWAAGKLPVRPAHVNPNLILDGSTGKDDPTGWLPFSQNPQIVNPERGVLYTANNQPDDMGSGPVPGYYVPSARARRIEELLFNGKSDWTEEDVRKVINDDVCSAYPDLLRDILPQVRKDSLSRDAAAAMQVLEGWDGRHGLEDVGPTVFYRFLYCAYRGTLADELGEQQFQPFIHSLALKRNMGTLLRNDKSPWWDDSRTPQRETSSQILTKAMNDAAAMLKDQLGEAMAAWKWKRVHSIEHKHPLGMVPLLGKLFNLGPFPVPGGQETINNLEFHLDSTGRYHVVSGPALRRVVDFGGTDHRFSVNPTGQSGYFMSPFYSDQARLFNEGGKRAERLDRKGIEAVKTGMTVFQPSPRR